MIDFHGNYLVAKTDPITFVSEDIGVYAIYINANDIAVMGGTPRWFLSTILMPEVSSTTVKSVEAIFSQISRACRTLGVTLCGGHTEVTPAVNKPTVIGQMLGTVGKKRLVTAAGARTGDDIIITKGVAVEGTSIIARIKGGELVAKGAFSKGFIRRCSDFIKDPGISVVADAEITLRRGHVHAMHDPTEGGLATGLHELAIASSCGIIVERGLIPVLPETERLCAYYSLDPMGVIASGALIASIDPRDTAGVLEGLRRAGIRAERIGKVTRKKDGVRITDGHKIRPIKLFERDEITKI